MAADEKKESKLEDIKKGSDHLRGTIAESLDDGDDHGKFNKDDLQLLKFHGTYQQDDRDVRHERRKQGLGEAWSFMVRCAIPGGILTADQYLALDDIGVKYGAGSLRVTTRQGIQYHGVIKGDLKKTIAEINDSLITTLAACGDVQRNVMACPAPLDDPAHKAVREVARELAVELRPQSTAYHEIWLDGEKHTTTKDAEPFYGDQYLPRKFKSGVSLAGDNCIDLYSYDLGLIAIVEGDQVVGFNVVAGGGMGMTHNKEDTFARLADEIGFVSREHAIEASRTVCAIFRDFGNRGDRRHARLKYVMEERGVDWFREEFSRRALFPLQPWRDIPKPAGHDHLGKQQADDGSFFYGIYIDNGRIKDNGAPIRSTLRSIIDRFKPGVVLSPHQNILLTGLSEPDIDEIEKMLRGGGMKPVHELSAARRFSMACPALPTCGLAMAESERFMPDVVDRFESLLTDLGLREVPLTMRMTGCPNGCSRPYTADLAFVGRRPGVYHIYVGGGMGGDRVADLYAADIEDADMVPTVRPLLEKWAKERGEGESLSDFYQKLLKRDQPRRLITGREDPTITLVQLGTP